MVASIGVRFLKIGSLALGGLSLIICCKRRRPRSRVGRCSRIAPSSSCSCTAGRARSRRSIRRCGAPVEIRSVTGEVQTRIPGVTFGGTFPKLAAMADKVSIVRSFTTGDGNHDIKPVVGRDTFGANLGSIYSHASPAAIIPTPACRPTCCFCLALSIRPPRPGPGGFRPLRLDRQPRPATLRSIPRPAAPCKATCGSRCRWSALQDRRYLLEPTRSGAMGAGRAAARSMAWTGCANRP